MIARYGGERIQRGFWHFIVGKGVSALAGVLAMLLVIRELTVESFAAYSVLVALVELLTALSGLGLGHALLRFVPELYSKRYQVSLRNLVVSACGLRTCVLLLAALIAYASAPMLAPHIGLGGFITAFHVFLVVVLLRSTSHFLSQILESTLHQGVVQFGFSLATLTRLAGMVYLLQQGNVHLVDVIWVEAIGDALSLLVILTGVIRVTAGKGPDDQDSDDDGSWLRHHLNQIGRFALAGYVQHLAITPYGGHTNRLVGGSMLNVGAMAAFGFAQSLYEYIKRYMPAQLLVGLIRPVLVARYCERRDFSVAAGLCGQVLQINILLIMGMGALLMVGGSDALAAVSAGKYGSEALLILGALFLVLLLETQRQQLELLVQTIERYQYLISSNLLLAGSVLLAVALLPLFGAVAFPAANAVGLIAANAWVQSKMRSEGFHFQHDWFATFRVVGMCVIAIAVGEATKNLGFPWHLAVVLTALAYAILVVAACGGMVRRFVSELTGQWKDRLPELDKELPSSSPKIAFGVLSSKQSTAAIDEIAAGVSPHPVYVHHDFSKQPDFAPTAANIHILQQTVATAWGDWSLVEASFSLMKEAMRDPDVTHFQLLSEACLPVRPIGEFGDYLTSERPDFMIDVLSLDDDEALVSHGWRYCTRSKWSARVMRRASIWIWGANPSYRSAYSVNVRLAGLPVGYVDRFRQLVGNSIARAFAWSAQQRLYGIGLKQFAIGGQWFGASRRAVEWLLQAREQCSELTRHFQKCHIPDESYVHTLVLNAQFAGLPLRIFPSNHAVFWEACGTGPDLIEAHHVERVKSSRKYFSRKFSLSKCDSARQSLLHNLAC